MTPREIASFCEIRLSPPAVPTPLAGDASTRCYYRLTRKGHAAGDGTLGVLMDLGHPFDPAQEPFFRSRDLLAALGLPVPRLHQLFPAEGLAVIEDLGDSLLQRCVEECPEEQLPGLYERPLDHLMVLHVEGTAALGGLPEHPASRETLDRDRFSFELGFTLVHYVMGLCRAALAPGDLALVREGFQTLAAEAAGHGRVLCHRDYHSRNLMRRGAEQVIIDFQDARWGPVTYDIASLLRDSYVHLPEAFVDETLERFRTRLEERILASAERLGGGLEHLVGILADPPAFRHRFDLTCLQRNLKALGTFGYQTTVRQSKVYLPYIPRTVAHARRNLARLPGYSGLLEVLEGCGALPTRGRCPD